MKLTMKKKTLVNLIIVCVALVAVVVLSITLRTANMRECTTCTAYGYAKVTCEKCEGTPPDTGVCEGCNSEGEMMQVCPDCEGTGEVKAESPYYATFMSLVPPIIAIGLALITKEVYSSLFVGVISEDKIREIIYRKYI